MPFAASAVGALEHLMRIGPLKLKAQLLCGDELAMGPGRADLLEAIQRTGSISAAGREMGMSYRRTWLLVDSMNRCFSQRLVETHSGGGPLRGARVTAAGRDALARFRALEDKLGREVAPELAALAAMVRGEPLPADHARNTI